MIPDKELRTRVEAALGECRRRLDAFAALDEGTPATLAVTQFDAIVAPLKGPLGWAGLLEHTHPESEVREECAALNQEIAAFHTEFALHRGAYEALASVDLDALDDPGARRLAEGALRRFRRAGVDRDDEARGRISELQARLVKVGQDFSRNIAEDGREFVVEGGHADLAGLPEDFLRQHPEREDGSVVLSADPTDRIPVLNFADDDDLRRDYFVCTAQVGAPANIPVLDALLKERRELAELLGYDDWADYATEEMMTGDADTVAEFLNRLGVLLREPAAREADELLELARERHPDWLAVPEWARGYWMNRLQQARAGVDPREARPYFGYSAVRNGMFALAEELYGIQIVALPDEEVWHDDVECYEIRREGELVARFWFDMHPRAGKYKHAAMFDLHPGGPGDEAPSGAIVCNLPKPGPEDPGLLLHDDVVTLFHEFGHLLHFLMGGRQGFNALTTGGELEWDFVEVPSQLFERWAWDTQVLQRFAIHHESGERIPAELVERMISADRIGRALGNCVQLFYATLSLEYYRADPDELDPVRRMVELKQELLPIPHTEGNWFHLSFGHLVGYSAAYYTYAWSLVIVKDMLSRFEGALLDPDVSREYAAKVLERGSSIPAAAMVEDFLGREYSFDAYENWLAEAAPVG
ncbi:MAG: M3 family metallopeptidase [Planctomycetota bacterium]|jgi:thimet oligopeptidase